MRPVVLVTDDTTRSELAVTLTLLCESAKRISRRGKVGTGSEAYRLAHERIDSVIQSWLEAGE